MEKQDGMKCTPWESVPQQESKFLQGQSGGLGSGLYSPSNDHNKKIPQTPNALTIKFCKLHYNVSANKTPSISFSKILASQDAGNSDYSLQG